MACKHLINVFIAGIVINYSCTTLVNNFSSMSDKNVDYKNVKKATQNSSIYIIDVREPQELKDSGVIPNSINIPRKF